MNQDVRSDQDAVLLTVQQVAKLINCSTRHVRRLADRGAMPHPVRIGTLIRWRRDEIERWVAAGCPSRWTKEQP